MEISRRTVKIRTEKAVSDAIRKELSNNIINANCNEAEQLIIFEKNKLKQIKNQVGVSKIKIRYDLIYTKRKIEYLNNIINKCYR